MESTGCYFEALAEFFHKLKFKVRVVNPLQIKAFRSCKLIRQKTDSVDSEIIAQFCLQNNPSLWSPKPQNIKELREINRRIESLKIERGRITNCLEKQILPKVVLKSINSEVKFLDKQIKQLETEIKKIVDNDPDLRVKFQRLSDIKGVGEKTALSILIDMPDVKNFEKSAQFASFAGVTPSYSQSGSSVYKNPKIGSKNVRKTLYMSAITVKNYNPYFQKFVQKLQKKGKPPKVIICAVMRKLMSIFFGMLKNNQNFDQNLAFAV